MPTYAYRGIQCPHEFETHQSFADDPLTECVECGEPVRRVIQLPGIVFKGSGWYITDSRSGGEKSPAASDKQTKEPASPTEASSDTKSTDSGSPKADSTPASTPGSTPAATSAATATKD